MKNLESVQVNLIHLVVHQIAAGKLLHVGLIMSELPARVSIKIKSYLTSEILRLSRNNEKTAIKTLYSECSIT